MADEEIIIPNVGEVHELWDFPVFKSESELKAEPHPVEEQQPPVTKEESELKLAESLELLQLKESLQSKIEILDELHVQFKQIISELDSELLQKIALIIKRVTHKIIDKELELNKQTLLNMIQATLKQMDDLKDCEVLISKEDLSKFNESDLTAMAIKFSVSPDLNSGDFKIVTHIGELSAILEDRVAAFLGHGT